MFFAAPIWLFGLIPWGIVAVVLLMSRRPQTDVPFLDLWQLNAPKEAIRRCFSTPPIGVILALLSALLAILSAAGPSIRGPGVGVLTVIVDAGAGTSSSSLPDNRPTPVPRYVEAGERLASLLAQNDAESVTIELIIVPGNSSRPDIEAPAQRIDASSLKFRLAQVTPTAIATAATVDRIVSRQLADPEARVIVLSDRRPNVAPAAEGSSRWVVVPPPVPMADNVGIKRLAVRRTPVPQAMVRVERSGNAGPTASTARRITVRLASAGQFADQTVELVPGAAKDLFVNLPAVGGVVTAELIDPSPRPGGGGVPSDDAFSADNRADLIVESDWPVIEPVVSVGELQRLIDLYSRSRPAGDRSIHVRLVPSAAALGTSPGIILPAVGGISRPTRPTRSADHPSLGGADLTTIDLPAAIDRTLPDGRWQVILSDGPGPLVAVRQTADPLAAVQVRQVWCAIDPRGWAQQVAYVVFWSAMLDWVGSADGGDQLVAYPLDTLTPEWTPVELAPGGEKARYWPGVYQRSDGVRRAFGPAQLMAAPEPVLPAAGLVADVARLLWDGSRVVPFSPWLAVGGIGLATAAAFVWRRKGRVAPVPSPVA